MVSFFVCEMPRIELVVDSKGRAVRDYGAQFSFGLSPAMEIPDNAKNVTLFVPSATIWFTTPNIVTNKTDRLTVQGFNLANVPTVFDVTIEQGLYSLSQLDTYINSVLDSLGAQPNTLKISQNSSTNKVVLSISAGSNVIFPVDRGIHAILGFPAGIVPSPGAVSTYTPKLNPVDSYLVHSSLCAQGIRINNAYSSCIAQVLVDVIPGEQIQYSPRFPFRLDVQTLVGITDKIDMWLTDTQNRLVDTAGEPWTVRIVIEYELE